MTIDLKLYWTLFLRRLPAMMVLFILCTTVAAVMAARVPNTYSTNARLLVQAPQIPGEMADTTVNIGAQEEIGIIRQQLLTRANLLDIARDQRVFRDYSSLSPDEVVQAMRRTTSISSSGGGRGDPALIDVAFEARSGQIAANVVNEYVTRIVNASVENRTGRAQDTLEFFQQEVDRLDNALSAQSARITEFQNKNTGRLPDDLNFRLNRQILLQERISNAERERSSLEDQRERIIRTFEANGGMPDTPQTPEQARLRELERELSDALTVYSETNPRVVTLRARIDQLRERITDAPVPQDTETEPQSILDLQLAQIDGQLENIEIVVSRAETELADLEASIAATPENAVTLQGLQRDYENIRNQYDRAVQRLAQASTGERIEVTARGQRITLIEPANVPSSPSSPNRPMMVATGAAFGLALAAGLFFLMELLNRSIRTEGELTRNLEIVPLITLPYLESSRRRFWRRSLQVASVLVVLTGVPALLWAIDTYYLPLDLLAQKVIDRVGLS
ncbi:polysaccharide chain length determinant protein, PEP-CTERM locus subfamily [Jannaschia seosinensis]|uniref:Polysaccharide chain length determinant protein, PEP-CTERM locus subfamily n=1 Tax=Jannaschia seosinensis TaxID=313367 RepID=A0A0M7BG72_9RHOB|nr:hypothetical protein [Jannaschia seosinensis]CUH40854.1 polysaccharide chain length determinant protein, PEP-CTERM locus subfamily [Jannaschia seosinensis]